MQKQPLRPEEKEISFMKKTLIGTVFAAVMIAGLLPLTGMAQGYYRRGRSNVNARESGQRARIREGVRNGSLTRREAGRLYNEQRRIESYERRSIRDDGRLDYQERRRLDRMLDRSNRDIYRQKTDDQNRYYRRRWYW
jgi:hypothetical protein